MRKSGVFSTTIFLSIIIAGLYGIIHDQITATISPEYFANFKFPQFNIDESISFRRGVAFVGFYATWWVGAVIGTCLASVSLIFPDHKSMKNSVAKALLIVFATTVFAGVLGYFYATRIFLDSGVNCWIPNDVVNRPAFFIVGVIHNAGYLGGLAGLLLGVTVLLWRRWKLKR